jgi:4-hydroxy-tetrahydrodipicolinate reductase
MAELPISVGVHGATGRMGTRLIQLIANDPGLRLRAAIERAGHEQIGRDAGTIAGVEAMQVALASSLPRDAAIAVMIDFSLPNATMGIAPICAERRIPLVVGTTGLNTSQGQILAAHAGSIPILVSPNMSRAVNLLMRLVGEAARALGERADIAIIERHHRTKKDAPSGTALRLGECASRRSSTNKPLRRGDSPSGEISMHSLRVADSPGEHTVIFALAGETIELSHRALNRDGFARGALEAARFLVGKPAGLYSMDDVLES